MAEFFTVARFEVDKRKDLTMTDTYQEIGNISMLNAVEGTYEYGFSMTHTFDQTIKSEFVRFSIDGGVTWTEFSKEPSDLTDNIPTTYNFFKTGASGNLSIIVEARKEDAVGEMIVKFIDTYIKRVK